MIIHIVSWRLKEANKAENAALIKEKLEALRGVIPEIHKIEVGIDFSRVETSADLAVYSEFKNRADLQAYIVHPAHQEVVSFIKEVIAERRLIDYERA